MREKESMNETTLLKQKHDVFVSLMSVSTNVD